VLLKQTPLRLETVCAALSIFINADYDLQLLNRRPPFGLEVLASARELPEYSLSITEVEVTSSLGGQKPVEVELSVECSLMADHSTAGASKAKKQQGRGSNMTTVLTLTSDLDFIDFRRIP
jgi:ATP-dependent DNA helicase HFM1/MER3